MAYRTHGSLRKLAGCLCSYLTVNLTTSIPGVFLRIGSPSSGDVGAWEVTVFCWTTECAIPVPLGSYYMLGCARCPGQILSTSDFPPAKNKLVKLHCLVVDLLLQRFGLSPPRPCHFSPCIPSC